MPDLSPERPHMKKTIRLLLSALAALSFSLASAEELPDFSIVGLGGDVRGMNTQVYVLLGNFDYPNMPPLPPQHHGWGRGRKPMPPAPPRPPRPGDVAVRPEYGYSDMLMDRIFGVLGATRRTKTADLRSVEELEQFLGSVEAPVYALEGTITDMSSETKFGEGGRVASIKTYIKISFRLTDMRTRMIVDSFQTDCNYFVSSKPTVLNSMNSCIDRTCDRVVRRLNTEFPTYCNVIKIDEVKKEKAQSLYIDLGSLDGIETSNHFHVYSIEDVAGHTIAKYLGKIRVITVAGGDISYCKVTSSGAEIYAASQAGKKLVCASFIGTFE